MTPAGKHKGSEMISNNTDEILTEREVCNWLGLSEPTLFRHRRDGTGPNFIRLSARRVGYRHSAVEAWLSQREQCTSLHSEAGDRPHDRNQMDSD
jgi:predicted DNA-binding transcriptional regulator AlpA